MSKLKIIAISGKQGSGKSTLAWGLSHQVGVQIMKFADPIYEMHDEVCDIAVELGLKPDKKEGRLLQLIGTEWGRERFGQDVWVNVMRHRLERLQNIDRTVIIDDLRFPNELAMLQELGAVTVRLWCDREVREARCDGWRGGDGEAHISEVALDGEVWDHVFNTGVVDVVHIVKKLQELKDEDS